METKPADYFDTKQLKPMYGIKVKHNGEWMQAGDDNGPLLFETEKERDDKRAELRGLKIPNIETTQG